MKKQKHKEIETDYETILADQILKNDEKMNQLKGKNINPDFLNLF